MSNKRSLPLHDEGGTIEMCSPIYAYARALCAKHDAPTVLKPCIIDGQPQVYATAYVGDDTLDEYLYHEDIEVRSSAALGFLLRADREVREIDNDPYHPAREEL